MAVQRTIEAISRGQRRLLLVMATGTRYDKTMRNYSAMVAIACMLTWLRI